MKTNEQLRQRDDNIPRQNQSRRVWMLLVSMEVQEENKPKPKDTSNSFQNSTRMVEQMIFNTHRWFVVFDEFVPVSWFHDVYLLAVIYSEKMKDWVSRLKIVCNIFPNNYYRIQIAAAIHATIDLVMDINCNTVSQLGWWDKGWLAKRQ